MYHLPLSKGLAKMYHNVKGVAHMYHYLMDWPKCTIIFSRGARIQKCQK